MAETQALTVAAKVTAVKTYIQSNLGAVKEALPRVGLTPEALTRAALSQIYKNPTLLEADKTSLMRAIVEAASLGLSFALGRAYLVPFKNKVKKNGHDEWRMEAQLIPGYQGLADVARRSGEISSINAQAVYQGDEFHYEFGLEKDILTHKPLGEPDPMKLTHAYAIVRFKDGGYQVRVMTRAQIDKVRSKSKSSDSLMWREYFDEGAIKTVVKRVLKLCPASPELVRAIELDNAAEMGERQNLGTEVFGETDDDVITVETEEEQPPQSKAEAMKAALIADEVEKLIATFKAANTTVGVEKAAKGAIDLVAQLDQQTFDRVNAAKEARIAELKGNA